MKAAGAWEASIPDELNGFNFEEPLTVIKSVDQSPTATGLSCV